MCRNPHNLRADSPVEIAAFGGDNAPHPISLGAQDCICQIITLNQPFRALRIGLPTWSAADCALTLSLHRAEPIMEELHIGDLLFHTRITDICDCEIRTVMPDRVFEPGTYALVLTEGGNGRGGHPGVWCFDSAVSDSSLFVNGVPTEGELQVFWQFTCTPIQPFGVIDDSGVIRPTKREKQLAARRFAEYLSDLSRFPTEITVGGVKYRGLADGFTLLSTEKQEEKDKILHHLTLRHESGLLYHLHATHYPDYAAYDWTAELENPTDAPSPRISDWLIASPTYPISNPLLRGIYGDGGFHHDPYAPYSVQLNDSTLTYTSPSGRSTYNRFPYFDLSGGAGGVIFVLGWPGKWRASFLASGNLLRIEGSQQALSTPIPPHARLISPLALFLEYGGNDQSRVTNLWRHFFIDCQMKREGDSLFAPHVSGGTSWLYAEMKDATDDNQIDGIRQYVTHGVPIDYWWMDAGWYYKTEEESLDVWLPVGTWVVDRKRFPSGMRAISDFGHANGVKTLLWFEPEITRLRDDELGSTSIRKEWIVPGSRTRLVDIGNDEFRDFMLERVFTVLDEGNIDLYRQDYGIAFPTDEMHAADAPGTSGYVENRTYQGYYDYLDRIAARYPSMMLDACAAGGGRNDLTTMRRCVPLHKTDADYSDYTMKTAMHQSLFAWLPYFGTPLSGPGPSMRTPDLYTVRCNYVPFLALGADVAHPELVDWEMYRRLYAEWSAVKDDFYSDYYPLLPWSGGKDAWRGWQFIDPEKGRGFFQLFRDSESTDKSKVVRLQGLSRRARYRLIDLDGGEDSVLSGSALSLDGLRVALPPRASKIYLIRKEEE